MKNKILLLMGLITLQSLQNNSYAKHLRMAYTLRNHNVEEVAKSLAASKPDTVMMVDPTGRYEELINRNLKQQGVVDEKGELIQVSDADISTIFLTCCYTRKNKFSTKDVAYDYYDDQTKTIGHWTRGPYAGEKIIWFDPSRLENAKAGDLKAFPLASDFCCNGVVLLPKEANKVADDNYGPGPDEKEVKIPEDTKKIENQPPPQTPPNSNDVLLALLQRQQGGQSSGIDPNVVALMVHGENLAAIQSSTAMSIANSNAAMVVGANSGNNTAIATSGGGQPTSYGGGYSTGYDPYAYMDSRPAYGYSGYSNNSWIIPTIVGTGVGYLAGRSSGGGGGTTVYNNNTNTNTNGGGGGYHPHYGGGNGGGGGGNVPRNPNHYSESSHSNSGSGGLSGFRTGHR